MKKLFCLLFGTQEKILMTNLNRAHNIIENYWNQIALANCGDTLQVHCPGCNEETTSAEFYHGIGYGSGFTSITAGANDMGGAYVSNLGQRTYTLTGTTCNTAGSGSSWTNAAAPTTTTPPTTAGVVDTDVRTWLLSSECAIPCCENFEPLPEPLAMDDYRYGFNGQERTDEVYGRGNLNTAEFWEYDTRLGRRWNIDPKSRVYESSYSVLGLNPIGNIDVNGDKWKDKNSENEANTLKADFQNKRDSYKKDFEKYSALMLKADEIGNTKNSDKYAQLAIEARTGMSDMDQAIKEIELMEKSDIFFELNDAIRSDGQYNIEFYGDWRKGGTGDKYIKVNYSTASKYGKTNGIKAHEMKHAAQVLFGYITPENIMTNVPSENFTTRSPYQNERDAYARQYFIAPNTLPFRVSSYLEINKDIIQNIISNGVFLYKFPSYDQGEVRPDSVY